MEDLRERVRNVEEKLDLLAASLNTRFDGVDAAFVEQRQYIELAVSRLEARMDTGDAQLEARLEARMDTGNARIEARMDAGNARLEARMDAGDARLEARMDAGDARLEARMDAGFDRLDAKIDAGFGQLKEFIAEQRQLNDLFRRSLNIRKRGRR